MHNKSNFIGNKKWHMIKAKLFMCYLAHCNMDPKNIKYNITKCNEIYMMWQSRKRI